MFQQPFVKLGVVVGFRPGIVSCFRIDREFHVSINSLQGVNHALGLGNGDRFILGTVKDPGGDIL